MANDAHGKEWPWAVSNNVSMLFVLIPIAWLAIIALCWVACKMAARGDAELSTSSSTTSQSGPYTREGLVIWEDLPELSVQDTRLTVHGVR